jgi:desulfoferrodoxin-like iron-binding protein
MYEMRSRGNHHQRWERYHYLLQPAHGNQKVRRHTMPSKLGKRYKCEVCGTEALSTKPGEGTLTCCDQEMKLQEPKTIPSSD